MLRFLIDENLDQRILWGLRGRFQQLDYVQVDEMGLRGSTDQELLEWAAQHGRIIISHDINTMTRHAYARLKEGEAMSGLIVVPDVLELGRVVRDLEIIIECGYESDLKNQIFYLPL